MPKTRETTIKGKLDSLIKTGDLLSKSWNFYAENWKKFVLILLIQFAAIIIVSFIFGGTFFMSLVKGAEFGLLEVVSLIIFYVLFLLVSLVFYLAMVYVFKDAKISIGDSFKKGLSKLGTGILLGIILTIVITIGYILFIIPGIIFTVWFSLAFYVLIFENKGAVDCLKRSKELVCGFSWSVFFKMIVMMLIQFAVTLLTLIPFIGWVINLIIPFIFVPLWLIYFGVIYQDLVKIKTKNKSAVEEIEVWKKVAAVLFVLIVAIFMAGFAFLSVVLYELGEDGEYLKGFDKSRFESLEEKFEDLDIELPAEIPDNINFNQGIDFEEFTKDTDNDNLPDVMEEYYLTDPENPDSDGDGVMDGDEIEAGTNPLEKD